MWKIYKHTSPSGKVYIGQTVQNNPNIRWQNGNGYKSHNSIFYLAIKKYGWENFKHEIIEDNIPSQEEANNREVYWISYYDSYRNGYNSTPGGFFVGDSETTSKPVCQIDSKTGVLIRTFKSESEAERKTGIKGRNIAACCLKQGQNTAGGYCWCFKEDLNSFEIPKNKSLLKAKKIYCLEYDKVFESIKFAAQFAGIHTSGIEAVCSKRNQITAGGLHWCYIEDKDDLLKYINEFNNKPRNLVGNRMVVQIDRESLNAIDSYESINDASRQTGISGQQIGKCASGKYLSAGGFYWCYKENYDENWKPLLKEKTNSKKIICIETNEIFENLEKASLKTKANKTSISQVCNKKLLTAGGYHFCWLSEFISNNYVIPEPKSKRKIVCIETQEVFDSISDAATKFNTFVSNIVSCCKQKQRTTKGFHFSYLDEYDISAPLPRKRQASMKKVVCVETKETFNSIKEAQEKYGTHLEISKACRNKSRTAGGYHWVYQSEYTDTYQPPLKFSSRFRGVICIETKIQYESIKIASNKTHIRPQYIGRACRDNTKTAGGFHWKYVAEK